MQKLFAVQSMKPVTPRQSTSADVHQKALPIPPSTPQYLSKLHPATVISVYQALVIGTKTKTPDLQTDLCAQKEE
jgi:hypothetical protein